MRQIKAIKTEEWEISFIELEDKAGKIYKVSRRFPKFSIAETRVFKSKKRTEKQFGKWSK